MKLFNVISTTVALVLGLSFSGLVLAHDSDSDSDSAQSWSRHGPNSPSGSGHTVAADCGGGSWDGNDYIGQVAASATIETSANSQGQSTSKIKVKNVRPNTHYTVWVRLKGASHGAGFGGSPLTGGGATPYAPSSELAQLVADSPFVNLPGSLVPRANGFLSDANGKGSVTVYADFYTGAGGAYPFNRIAAADLALTPGGIAPPTAIADPRDPNMTPGTPFLLRMVSHCQDDSSHGLSPGARETWFNFP